MNIFSTPFPPELSFLQTPVKRTTESCSKQPVKHAIERDRLREKRTATLFHKGEGMKQCLFNTSDVVASIGEAIRTPGISSPTESLGSSRAKMLQVDPCCHFHPVNYLY